MPDIGRSRDQRVLREMTQEALTPGGITTYEAEVRIIVALILVPVICGLVWLVR